MSAPRRPTAPLLEGRGNLKPAPLALTAALVGKLTGDRPPFGKRIVHLPIEGTLCSCLACRPGEHEADDIDWMGGGLDYV